VKKKGEAFGGSQKKDCKDQLQQPHFYCFVWETASTEHPTVLGEYFLRGETPSIALLGWYFNLCDLMFREKKNIWVGQMTILTMINYECFCINRSMSMANSSFMHSIDTR